MKKLICLIAIFSASNFGLFAQCPEVSFQEVGQPLVVKEFEVNKDQSENEVLLTLQASAKNTSWETKGSESAVLTIFIDGRYNQDILLVGGKDKFSYRVVLGKFPVGKHKLVAAFNRKRSAKKIGKIRVSAINVNSIHAESDEEQLALANAPFLYVRPDTVDKFSDIPLLTYYEVLPSNNNSIKIRYTTIFTNEDGGTRTAALMARWGRTTDIEWVYEIETKNGEVVSELFQGANHITKSFAGQRIFGSHPLIFNVTVNNNFADVGCSALRMAQLPLRADLSKKSRETVMDENPWIYRLMAQETVREGRIKPDNLGDNTIADLRDYMFAEISNAPNNASISVEAKASNGIIYSSDGGNKFLRVDRSGFSRIAVYLPRTVRRDSRITFSVVCHPKDPANPGGACQDLNLLKIVELDDRFSPKEIKISGQPRNIATGEKAEFEVKMR